jgi:hypothetical protein
MEQKTYRFAVHSPHFLVPIYIKRRVAATDSWDEIFDAIAKEATAEWMKDGPSDLFDNMTAPAFYETLAILVSQEVSNVQPE